MNILKSLKRSYAWLIVLAGFLITFSGMGVVNSMSGVLIKPICESLGFARGTFTFHRTVMTLVGAFLLPVYVKVYNRIGIKKAMIACSISIAAVTFAYSFATEIWHFYLIALLNGVFINGPSFLTVGILINNWFEDKRGMATGIAYAGSGIGSAVLIPLVAQIAESMNWQAVYRFAGAAILLILLPVVLFLVKDQPQDMGLKPYRKYSATGIHANDADAGGTGVVFSQAVKTPMFWMLILSFFLLSIMAGGPNINTVPYLTDIGYSTAFASFIMSLLMLTHMTGNVALGGFFDRFGMLKGSLLLSLCCIIFPILAINAKNSAFIWIYTLFYGVASAGFATPATVFVSTYFGKKDFAAIFSVFTIATQVGTALAGPSMSFIYDITGSYFWGWIMLLGFGLIILLCLTGAFLLSRKAMRPNSATTEEIGETEG